MNKKDFRDFLLNLQRPFIVKVETETPLKLNKKHRETGEANPYLLDEIVKMSERVGKIGVAYANAVTNQRGREARIGEFIEAFHAEKLWNGKGEHIKGALVRHRDTLQEYMAILPNSTHENKIVTTNDILFSLKTGQEIKYETLVPFLPPPRDYSKNKTESSQETDKRIFWQTIALENIKGIIYKGESIKIDD